MTAPVRLDDPKSWGIPGISFVRRRRGEREEVGVVLEDRGWVVFIMGGETAEYGTADEMIADGWELG